MIFEGRYSLTTLPNPLAPFIEAFIRSTDDRWVEVFFLIDLGADATYLPSEFVQKLGIQLNAANIEDNVTGAGGQRTEYIPFTTQMKFESNGVQRTFDLEIGVFTEDQSLDFPVLGRDIINFFTLVCDTPANLVWLADEVECQEILKFCDSMNPP
jgi:hypothetical protein